MTTQTRRDPARDGTLYRFMQEGAGNVFYVHGSSGLDTNDGRTPESAFLTITAALAVCTAGANDYIFVISYPGDAGEAAWPIPIDTAKVHIIGTPTQASPSPLINAPDDTACFTIYASAGNTEIAGLEMTCGATAACIDTSGIVWKANIHHNYFAWQDAGAYGIQISNNTDNDDCPQWHVHDNWFGNKLTSHNIWIPYNSTRTVIERNRFLGVADGAIGVYIDQAGAAVGAILDNYFKVYDGTTGQAITCIAGTIDTMITGNVTGEGQAQMGSVPYRDLGGCHWGNNYYSIIAIMPVTV